MKPLSRLPSIKLKLGLLIVFAICTTAGTMLIAADLGMRLRWGALSALVVSLVAVQVLARGTTSPLRAMAAAAEAMARGEHGRRVPEDASDEVGQLGASFNAMASELEALDRARREMLADAAHELRTPITALQASLENAVDGVGEPDLEMLLGQVRRLGGLAEQLLDLSALEAGGATLERRRFAVAELAYDCPADIEIPAGLRVDGDPDRLRQVVTNLVENAHRHAPGTPVVLRAAAGPAGGVRLEVQDGGPGMTPEDAARVFDRFARTDRSRTKAGSGLGLAIARSIVELHGGAIRAEPADPTGLRMVVDLPGDRLRRPVGSSPEASSRP